MDISELSAITGRHTELVSLYIPSDTLPESASSWLVEERTQALNIKSRQTRANVELALTKVIQKLKTYDKFPKNGLMVFAGETTGGFILQTMEPPKPIFTYVYKCGSELYLDPLQVQLQNNDLTGVISIDTEQCGVGIIDGPHCFPIKVITSGVPGKSSKGGSSARRYERNRDAGINGFFHRAADLANTVLLQYGDRMKHVVVSGPGFTPDDFLKKHYLDYRLRAKLSPVVGIEYAGQEGLYQTLNRVQTA